MNGKIMAILLIAMLAAIAFTGCAAPPDDGGEPTPTPEPDADAASIPMPENTGEGEGVPELPI